MSSIRKINNDRLVIIYYLFKDQVNENIPRLR